MDALLTLLESAAPFLRAILILIIGGVAARFVRTRVTLRQLKAQQLMLLRRIVSYGLMGLALAWALSELGINLRVLLGAAGVFAVAVGFAAQTTASNFISGLFLMTERPFVIGDVITVEGTTGEVLSVDLLSVKLRTFDNLLVRIPNEVLFKSRMSNLTHFPIRRYDMKVGVAYKEDITKVRAVLAEVAERNPVCLDEPPPLFIFLGFGESSLDFQFSVWAARENYLALRNSIHELVKQAFDEHGIEIPFPHRTLYAGSQSRPFAVEVVSGTPSAVAGEHA